MSGIQVAQGQERFVKALANFTQDQCENKLEYITGQNTNGQKRAMDAVIYGLAAISTANVIAAGSTKRVIIKSTHNARKNDVVQFTSGTSEGVSIQILSCPDADTMILAATSEFSIAVGDTFDIKRYVTPQYDEDGALVVVATPGPIQFELNGVPTEVSKDTAVPANTIGLPVEEVQKQMSEKLFLDYSVDNVTNAAYTELIAATASLSKGFTWFDGGGRAMTIALGAAGLEVDYFYSPPGGFNGVINIPIPAGSRVSTKCLDATTADFLGTVDIGLLVLNLLK